jgi:hypothetical protein
MSFREERSLALKVLPEQAQSCLYPIVKRNQLLKGVGAEC